MKMSTVLPQQKAVTEDVLAAGIEALRSQISLAMKRSAGDDLTVRLFESALLSLDNLVSAINIRLDDSVDEFNRVVDLLEQYQEDMNTHHLEVVKLCGLEMGPYSELAGLLATRLEDLKIQVQHANNRTDASMLMNDELRRSFNKYKKDYPESLVIDLRSRERDNNSLKRERKALKEEIAELGKSLREHKKKCVHLESDNLARAKEIQTLKENDLALRETLDEYSGIRDKVKCFDITKNGGNGGFAYIYSYPFGLAADVGRRHEVILTARFHFQIRTSHLLAMDVIPTIWGAPLYNRLKDFEENWNTEIDEELHQRIMMKLEKSFPKLHRRISASKVASVDELDMRPTTLVVLKALGFTTVFNVASIPSTFMPSIEGLDKQMDEEIVASVRMWASKWDKQNGIVEELYGMKNTVTGQVFYKDNK